MFDIRDNIRKLLVDSMNQWRTELTLFGEVLGEVSIKGGIFQGDSVSPLLFLVALISLSLVLKKVLSTYEFSNNKKINLLLFKNDLKFFVKSEKGLDSLVQTIYVFIEDIGMKFSIEKCPMRVMGRGKIVKSEGIEFTGKEKTKSLDEKESYRY